MWILILNFKKSEVFVDLDPNSKLPVSKKKLQKTLDLWSIRILNDVLFESLKKIKMRDVQDTR